MVKCLLNKQCFKQWKLVSNTPWLTTETNNLVSLIVKSHLIAFGEPLLTIKRSHGNKRLLSEQVFLSEWPILAHEISYDPFLTYANATALKLWRKNWVEMIGMPSRNTAPLDQQEKRQRALKNANQQHAIKNYQGIRINSKGERFRIQNARIWTIWNKKRLIIGQAATFTNWEYL